MKKILFLLILSTELLVAQKKQQLITAESKWTRVNTKVIIHKPRILNFNLEKDTIFKGESTKLLWTVKNADKIEIEIDGKVTPIFRFGEELDLIGNKEVFPIKNTTYRLKAGDSTVVRQLIVQDKPIVIQPTIIQPEIVYFKAEKSTIKVGETTKLMWSVKNVESTDLERGNEPQFLNPWKKNLGIEGVEIIGNITATKYYQLKAGNKTAIIKVTVEPY